MDSIFDNIDSSLFNDNSMQGIEMLLDNACANLKHDIPDATVFERDQEKITQDPNGNVYTIHHTMDFTPDMYTVQQCRDFVKFAEHVNKFMSFGNLIFKKPDRHVKHLEGKKITYNLTPAKPENIETNSIMYKWFRSYEHVKQTMGSVLKNGIRSTSYEEINYYAFDFEILKTWIKFLYWMLRMDYQYEYNPDNLQQLLMNTNIFFKFTESYDCNDVCLNTLEECVEFFQWCIENEDYASVIKLENPYASSFIITIFCLLNERLPVAQQLLYDDVVTYQKSQSLDCCAREILELINSKIKL